MRRVGLFDPRGLRWAADVPEGRGERMRGLRGRSRLRSDEAMLFERCRSVHTFGVREPIAVALMDRELTVLSVGRLPVGRIVLPRRGVRHVLELPIGADVRVGDRFTRSGRESRTTPGAQRTARRLRT